MNLGSLLKGGGRSIAELVTFYYYNNIANAGTGAK